MLAFCLFALDSRSAHMTWIRAAEDDDDDKREASSHQAHCKTLVCLPAVHKNAVADAPGALEGRNAINETSQRLLARRL